MTKHFYQVCDAKGNLWFEIIAPNVSPIGTASYVIDLGQKEPNGLLQAKLILPPGAIVNKLA